MVSPCGITVFAMIPITHRRDSGISKPGMPQFDRSFIRPLQQNQAVRVTGTRKGKPLELLYVNAAACLKSR